MSDDFDSDPFADEAPPKKARRKGSHDWMAPEKPDDTSDLDRVCANYQLNDYGNGQRFIQRHGQDFRYVAGNGWVHWDGARFDRENGDVEALKAAHSTSREIFAEAAAVEANPGRSAPEKARRLMQWAVISGNQAKASALLSAAAPYNTVSVRAFDTDPYLLAAPNGTIRLGTQTQFRDADRADLLSRCLGVAYDTKGQCPHFLRFLERIMPDPELRSFLQRLLGYCLTGSTSEQVLFLFYGTGRNGKSTLINILRHILGDYAMISPVQTFLAKREGSGGSEASPDIARLPGARLVAASEPPEGARLDESRVKEMTGGERMTARHLNQGFFEFDPVFKAIISTNHRPAIRGTDEGIWRRIRLVPFTQAIPLEQIDRQLGLKLMAEAPGILQWLLDGCEQWFDMGLSPPASAIAAVEAYRADEDPVGEFLKARTWVPEINDPSTGAPYDVSAKELRAAYVLWCKDEGLDPLHGKTFGAKMTGRGFARRKSHGNTMYVGLQLNGNALVGGG